MTLHLLAISDHYIPRRFMEEGLASLRSHDVEVEVRPWEHATLEELQEANLAIEQGGPEAVPLPEELYRDLDRFDIIVTQFPPIPRRFLEAATRLRLLGVLRGGVENVDVACATQRGVVVFNTPGRNARAVAECTVGLILTEVRNLARAHAALKQGVWTRDFPNRHDIPELLDKTVGLVGFGAVGQLVATFLHAFGSKIVVHDPFLRDAPDFVTPVDLETLMRQSDIISLHARYTEKTHHLLDRRHLEMMKPTAVLVNTARSGLVDETVLVELLASRKIMGAALDVFDDEPLPAASPFLTLDNVTIVPHVAGSTVDAFRNSPKLFAAHFLRSLHGAKASELPIINSIEPQCLRTRRAD